MTDITIDTAALTDPLFVIPELSEQTVDGTTGATLPLPDGVYHVRHTCGFLVSRKGNPMAINFTVKALDADVTLTANQFDPELTYFADGTPVEMRWTGGERRGMTVGMSEDVAPYAFQAVRWDDGTEDGVAPHVLHRVA